MSKIQVNEIVNHFDTGAPDCPKGLTVTGFSTFTGSASFSGDVSIGGTLTYEDVTNIDSVGVITARNGIEVTGGTVDIGTETSGRKILYINSSDNGAAVILRADSATRARIEVPDGSSDLIFGVETATTPTERLRITSGGNLGIGTDNPTHQVSIAGSMRVQNPSNADQFLAITHQGIDFGNNGLAGSATTSVTTSHLLDDYEEGTWTPVYTGRATNGTAINNRAPRGTYVKIGKQVTVQFDFDQTNTTASGNAQIMGLPYPATTGPYRRYTGSIIFSNNNLTWSGSGSPLIYLNDGNNAIWIVQNISGSNYQFIDRTSNRFECWGVITYFID
ncbi:tail fiber protein [Synechococcus phage S-B05]|nr:tail fiber protein [Synechococcus phage S-B05]